MRIEPAKRGDGAPAEDEGEVEEDEDDEGDCMADGEGVDTGDNDEEGDGDVDDGGDASDDDDPSACMHASNGGSHILMCSSFHSSAACAVNPAGGVPSSIFSKNGTTCVSIYARVRTRRVSSCVYTSANRLCNSRSHDPVNV